jgi:murein DD-endopeptidase MepM/ murein hydrolase activator NlpD
MTALLERPAMKSSATIRYRFLLLGVLYCAAILYPQLTFASGARPPLLTVSVIQNPDPMTAFDQAYLVYELLLTSYDSSPIRVTGLRVGDPDSGSMSFTFSGADLAGMIQPIGAVDNAADHTTITSGQTRLVYVWLAFSAADKVPRRLAHLIQCRAKREAEEDYEIEVPPIQVREAPPLSIGPPLRGGDWIAEGGPSNSSYHRRARMAVDGVLYFAQRFAIDYVKVTPDGHTHTGDLKKNSNYLCYGAEILAVADGKIVALKDSVPENTPDPVARAVQITMDTAGGNFVALDLGYHRYALYGHLIPGSLKVKAGDSVKRGQVLASLGNSGNSTEPHLHFQIADQPSFLGANGLPYLYDEVGIKPTLIVDAKSDPPVIQANGPAHRSLATMVLENDLVVFPK